MHPTNVPRWRHRLQVLVRIGFPGTRHRFPAVALLSGDIGKRLSGAGGSARTEQDEEKGTDTHGVFTYRLESHPT